MNRRLGVVGLSALFLAHLASPAPAQWGDPAVPLAASLEGDLAMLADWLALPAFSEPHAPVPSATLGASLPPRQAAAALVAKANAHPDPLHEAALAWNQVLAIRDPESLDGDPEWTAARSLPRPVQVAAAALLMALTDATVLQRSALDALPAEDAARLVELPLMLATPGAEEEVDALLLQASGSFDVASVEGGGHLAQRTRGSPPCGRLPRPRHPGCGPATSQRCRPRWTSPGR
jgi:hypothetical protein